HWYCHLLASSFCFTHPATTNVYTLSLHDALPIFTAEIMAATGNPHAKFMHCLPSFHNRETEIGERIFNQYGIDCMEVTEEVFERSEEHTSELQSRENIVCRLLLEKKIEQVRMLSQ